MKLINAIDRFTERTGALVSWLMAPLLAAVIYEVVARYAFGAPTMWAYETITILYAAMFMLGAAYALRTGAHVRTDFLSQKWSVRTRAEIETVAYAVFFFPGMLLFLVVGAEWAWSAYLLDERSPETAWFPPLWSLKAVVPLSALPPMAMLKTIVVLIFLLGWPFEWPAIVLVFVPIFYPVVEALGIDRVWFGALVALTLQTAFLSPPVAMAGYYLKQVAANWPLSIIFRGMLQFMCIQVVAIALLLAFPAIATWLPDYLFRTGALVASEASGGVGARQDYGDSYLEAGERPDRWR